MVWFVEYDPDMKAYWVYTYKSGAYVTIAYDDRYANIREQAVQQGAELVWLGKPPYAGN